MHWMGKASCFLGRRRGVMILTMDAGKSLFIKFVCLFFWEVSSPPPPTEKKVSVNWEAELLNKYMLTPDFPSCLPFTVCYSGVISWLLLIEAHTLSCNARPWYQKCVC